MTPAPLVKALMPAAMMLGLILAVPAAADQIAPPLSLEEVGVCLCLEQAMKDRQAEMDLRQGILKERENELERLGMEIQVRRASMNPEDAQAIADLKAMIERQNSLRLLMSRDIVPSYQESVAAYNRTVAAYNESCANKRIYKPDVEKLQQQGLQCPPAP